MTNTQEIKTVNYEEYIRELHRIQKKYRSRGSLIEIFEMGDIYESSPIQVGVNWAATGTVSPVETEEFAHALLKAAEDCKNFKYNGYMLDWAAPLKKSR